MSVFPRSWVEAPPVTPLPYGLFSAALVLDPSGEDGDRQGGGGVHYQPEACAGVHRTLAACVEDGRDPGTASISVDTAREATLTTVGSPDGTEDYTIRWGDGDQETVVGALSGTTHTYAADGSYTVFIEGSEGWTASGAITVTNGAASGPYVIETWFGKATDDGVPLVGADPFVVYHLHRCRPVGQGQTVAQRAEAALKLGEQRAIEAGFAEQLAALGAVDLNAAGAVHPVDGLAMLEAYAAANYGGIPVIHIPRDVGTHLGAHGAIARQGQRLETTQGAYVASGGGYVGMDGPGGAAPAAGEAWLYVTGVVVVRRLPIIEAAVPESLRAPINESVALVERPVVVTAECIAAAVRVEVGPFNGAAA